MYEHKHKLVPGFTAKYGADSHDVGAAIAREKQIKGWTRKKKLALVASKNPEWKDLAGKIGLTDGER